MTTKELIASYGEKTSQKEHNANLKAVAGKAKAILESFVKKTLSSKSK